MQDNVFHEKGNTDSPYVVEAFLEKEEIHIIRVSDRYRVSLPKRYWMKLMANLGYEEALGKISTLAMSMHLIFRSNPTPIINDAILQFVASYKDDDRLPLWDIRAYRTVWKMFNEFDKTITKIQQSKII